MTASKQWTSSSVVVPPPISQPAVDVDSVGVEVEDFGLEFDSTDQSDKQFARTPPSKPPEKPAQQSESPTASWYAWNATQGDGETTGEAAGREMIPSELRMAGWYISQSGSAHEGPFGEEMIRLRLANGTLSSDCLIWRHGMQKWAKLQSVPELHTAPLPTNTNAGPTPIESMDWANLSLMSGWALLVVSVLGGYWGYSQ